MKRVLIVAALGLFSAINAFADFDLEKGNNVFQEGTLLAGAEDAPYRLLVHNEPTVDVTPEQGDSAALSDTNAPDGDIRKRLISFAQNANESKTFIFAIYPSYAPQLEVNGKKNQFGFGAAALYQVNQFLFTGLRVDYLGGEFWAPSISLGAKADVQVLGYRFTPIVYSGGVVPLSGAKDKNGDWGYILGAGFKAKLWEGTVFKKKASVDLAATFEKWIPLFKGEVFHIAPAFKVEW